MRAQERGFLGLVGVAVFGHPRRAGQELVEAQHVEERHLDDHGAEQFGALGQHRAHQQPAVRPAHDAEPARRGDLAPDQILGDGDEIVEGALAVLLQRGLVPFRAELAAAADIGDDIDAARLEPRLAERAGIGRGHRHLEPAIAVEQGRRVAVEGEIARPDDEIRHRRAVVRDRLELLDDGLRRRRTAPASI